MGNFKRGQIKLVFQKESTRRDPSGITETDPGNLLKFDKFQSCDIKEPAKTLEESYPVHGGRNVSEITELDYPIEEMTIECDLQTGILLMFALGACSTTGSGPTYYHAISESDTLYSFAIRLEQLLTSNNIIKDLIGCHVKEIRIILKKEEKVKCNVTFLVPKSIDATANILASAVTNFTDKVMNWANLSITTFTADSVDISGYPCESMEIAIMNDVELLPILGDAWRDEPAVGKREYEVKCFMYPQSSKLYTLRRTDPADYTVALTFKLARNTSTDYILFTFSNLYVSDYPNMIPDMEEKDVGIDVTFRNNAGGTLAIGVMDSRGIAYYEVS